MDCPQRLNGSGKITPPTNQNAKICTAFAQTFRREKECVLYWQLAFIAAFAPGRHASMFSAKTSERQGKSGGHFARRFLKLF
jgi:hypothetical protein